FNLKQDPTFAPVWIDLPGLPLEFFHPALLKVIGDDIGKFLAVAKDTVCRTRPGVARICAEINIHEDLPTSIWLEGPSYPGFWQPIFYPNFLYCSHCYKIGHSLDNCFKKNGRPVEKGKQKEGNQSALGTEKNPTRLGQWQTQRPKQVYKQVADYNNVNMAGTSGSKNSHGQEKEVSGSEKVMANNSFAVLNTIEEEETFATDKSKEDQAVNAKVLSEAGEEVEEETVQIQGIAKFVEGVFQEAETLPQDLGSEELNPEKEVPLPQEL
ncbi:hypothetical protein FRX31_030975, partial [Thalictrum thalictroides]